MIETQTCLKILALRGGEYMSNNFIRYCEQEGIERKLTHAYTPRENGVVALKSIIFMECVGPQLIHGLRLFLQQWTSQIDARVERIGEKPLIKHLRIFSSLANVYIPEVQHNNSQPKAHKCMLAGYDYKSKVSFLFSP